MVFNANITLSGKIGYFHTRDAIKWGYRCIIFLFRASLRVFCVHNYSFTATLFMGIIRGINTIKGTSVSLCIQRIYAAVGIDFDL